MIPFAGFVFWTLPAGSLYDSNLLREAGFKNDLATETSLLTNAIETQEYDYYSVGQPNPDWSAFGGQFRIRPGFAHVVPGSVTIDTAGNISLAIRFYAHNVTLPPSHYDQFSDFVTLSPFKDYGNSPSGGTSDVAYIRVSSATTADSAGPQAPLDVLLPLEGGASPNFSLMRVPLNTAILAEHLSAAGQGDPKGASGFFIRMCYFSAITITTLGFGDISPVSSAARIIVAIEAVLGVVFIGLFLNAVAQKWKKDDSQTSPL